MSELSRLLYSAENPQASVLLASALGDTPPSDALERAARALGVTATTVALAAPAAALMSAAGTTTASGSSVAAGAAALSAVGKVPGASGLSVLALSKWLVAGALGGTVVAGTAHVVERTLAPVAPARSARTAASPAPRAPRRVHAPQLALDPMPEMPHEPELGSAAALASVSAPAPVPSAPKLALASGRPMSSGDALGAEAARLDAARRALENGELERALAELDAYQRVRSLGVLDREALLLRIRVLVEQGEQARALVLAQSYLASHPNDAHAARLRALIANGGTSWPNAEGIDRRGERH
jgi:hypothetical protein